LYTAPLAKLGANVTGIDFSERSIQYAREVATREGLDVNYLEENYLEFETEERFDLVMMIMCDFCALSPKQRKVILGIFHRILKPGGSVLLDVYSLEAFRQREETEEFGLNPNGGFWSPDKYYSFLNTFKYPEEKVVLDKYTIIQSDRTRTVYNWLQYFSPDDIEREFEIAGLSIKEYYSDVTGIPLDQESAEFAVVANRLPLPGGYE
jgi:SAM-dependent methyltransferase